MALKFRRGTTAQQSGSLAFGEPYVNTDLGTLLVGGPNGDILLAAAGTSSVFVGSSVSASSFISGSSLKITGNATIDGNVTIGGAIQIGDQTSDVVNVVASLSSSLIPQTSNVFDLGSPTKFWRDLYISTGSINFVDNSGNIVSTLSSNASGDFNINGEFSASSITGIGNVSSYSQSVNSRLIAAEAFSSSLDATFATDASVTLLSSSVKAVTDTFATSASVASATADSISTLSSSVATTITNASSSAYSTFAKLSGGNVFSGTQTVTGSVYVSGDFIVQGSSSLQNITASAVTLGTNTIVLNTATPAVRFGGISVIDSGSSTGTGSLWWDSIENHWVYEHPADSGAPYNSAMLIAGPKNTGSLGEEVGLTLGFVPVAVGSDHIGDSIISASATKVTIAGGLDTTGNVSASTITGIGNVSAYSTSVASRINTIETTYATSASIASATATSISTLSASIAITDATQTENITTAQNSANGAFASASAYSSSFYTTVNTVIENVTTAQNSANGAFASASAYSASAVTTYAKLAVANTFTANQIVSGSITATGDVVAFSTSDRRHKNNIVLISDALTKVTKLNGVTWEWNEDVDSATKETPKTGLIAQEVQEVLPEVVKERGDGFLALDYSKMMGLMVEAIKEQQTQIHSLTLEIEKLKKDNSL